MFVDMLTQDEVQFDEPMSKHTTIKIGGPADALVTPKSLESLEKTCRWARSEKIDLFVLGGGSNILVRDGGIRGVVIKLTRCANDIQITSEDESGTHLYIGAGLKMPSLIQYAIKEGLTGIEPLVGIPSTVGGAVVMNAGTPDGTIGDILEYVVFLNPEGELVKEFRDQLELGYRSCKIPKGHFVLGVGLKLKRGDSEGIATTVRQRIDKRNSTQPLSLPNLGCIFKNPAKREAGSLIEEAGLKEVRIGGARVSGQHANFIVNEGGGKARDVLALVSLIKDKVRERFGIALETEIKVVGEDELT